MPNAPKESFGLMTRITMIKYDFICVYHNHQRHLRSIFGY